MSNTSFYDLKVSKIVRETPEASTLYFEIPQNLKASFGRKPGQYLTIEAEIEGESIRRAYSICTGVFEEDLGVTVKIVHGGLMSTYLNQQVKEGQMLKVLPPEGNFVLKADHDKKRTHIFIAAGSGITPIMSMAKSLLEEEPMSTCHLIYGNRNINTVIFKKELDDLVAKYTGQLFVEHVLSRPVLHRQSGITGLFKKPVSDWKGKTGRIDADIVEAYIQENNIQREKAEYYVCGPGDMIVNIEKHLKDNLNNSKQVHVEYFSVPESAIGDKIPAGCGHVEVRLNGTVHQLEVPKEKSILDVLIEKGAEPPYSCTSGACSSCLAKVIKGKVSMDACFALDDDEIEDGYILTCQSHPQSENVVIEFEG